MKHCLLGGIDSIGSEQELQCWQEMEHILACCGRDGQQAGVISAEKLGSASLSEKRTTARTLFVACLAEWVAMHDHHKPFPFGVIRQRAGLLCCGP